MTRFGAVIPVRPGQWAHLPDTARAIEAAGWQYAFADEGPYAEDNDSLASALVMATATSRVNVGSSVAITYLRHPYNAASFARVTDEVSGGRMVLGLGCSHAAINQLLGIEMGSPVGETRRYVQDVRRFLGPSSTIPIWLAALREPMARLAGEVADTANFHHNAVSDLGRAIAAVREGERRAGRPGACGIALYARIVLADDLAEARAVGRATLQGYCRLPAYQDLYTRAGYGEEMAALRAGYAADDQAAIDRALTDALLDDVLVLGPVSRCRDRLDAMVDAGVDTILFAPLSTRPGVTLVERFAPIVRAFPATS